MNLTKPLKWHGGKDYLADRIVALMPPHLHYVEAYAGGLSVLLAKDPEGVSEVANDLNKQLTNFWMVLQNERLFGVFLRQVEAIPFSEVEYLHSLRDCNWPEVEAAARFFVRCRQSLAGRMKGFASVSRTRTRRGMNEQVSAWINAIDGLPAVHARLRRVLILNHAAVDVIRQQDGPDTLYYLDPPYLHETRASTGQYKHEMSGRAHAILLAKLAGEPLLTEAEFLALDGEEKYPALLAAAKPIKARFLLSGYDSGLYRRFEQAFGWRRRVFDLPNNSAGGEKKRVMHEVVWANYDLPAGEP
jgi:DNA adenine methylase